MTPTPFGNYYLLDRINVGGMAEVFRAKAFGLEGFERLVAVKRILSAIAEDKEFIDMFVNEAKIAVQLTHANIAQIFDLGQAGGNYYIAMEYIHGKDLRAIFDRCCARNQRMSIPQACYLVMKVCEGLDYAHSKRDDSGRPMKLVHRDVSPQNILIAYEGDVKLIDFGVAKAAGSASKTQAGILKGKFGYMSPEQVRGLPLDRRSDIFSITTILHELLTGERLFCGETDFSTLEKVRNADVTPPSLLNPEVTSALEQIVMQGLAKDVDDRYQSAIDLHDDLQAFLYTSGVFYSRKDLAGWMRQSFSREIEEDTRALAAFEQMHLPAPGDNPLGAAPSRVPSTDGADLLLQQGRVGIESDSETETVEGDPTDPGWEEEIETQIFERADSAALPLNSAVPQKPTASGDTPESGVGSIAEPVSRPRRLHLRLQLALGLTAITLLAILAYRTLWQDAEPGSVSVVSSPGGTAVYVDGKRQPRTAPLRINGLKPGFYVISLRKAGFATWEDTIEVQPGRRTRINAKLALLPTATIEVRTQPPGAQVLLDGDLMGGVTPMRINSVAATTHLLEIRKAPDHQPMRREVRLNPRQTLKLSLNLLPWKVSLRITSRPQGDVSLEQGGEVRKAGRSPLKLEVNPRLPLTITVTREGYEPWSKKIQFDDDAGTIRVTAQLVRKKEGTPDRRGQDRTASQTRAATEPDLSRSGRPRHPQAARTRQGRRTASRKDAGVSVGTLAVNTKPWTRIYIDDRPTGMTTPQRSIPLSPGTHEVRLVNPQFKIDAMRTVRIRSGTLTKLVENFTEPATPAAP